MALSTKQAPGLSANPLTLFMAFLIMTMCSITSASSALTAPAAPIKSRDKFFAVHFIDTKHGFIVGDKGLILYTETGGEAWERREQPMHYPFYDITFCGGHGWIVGGAGTIIQSADGGKPGKPKTADAPLSL